MITRFAIGLGAAAPCQKIIDQVITHFGIADILRARPSAVLNANLKTGFFLAQDTASTQRWYPSRDSE